jgi:phenylacetate-CoA ligase
MLNAALWWPTQRIWLDASDLSERSCGRFLAQFNTLKPALLQGYVGAIQELAEYVERTRTPVHSPSAVWLTASPIPITTRSLVERVFRAPVYDQYGSCETPWLAAECRLHDGLHIFSDAAHIDFVTEDGDPSVSGTPGRVLVTDLENKAFPLIRYANGDIGCAQLGACPCGLPFPLMRPVQGRVTERILLPDGTAIAGEYLTTLFDAFPDAVVSFQVLQHADYSVTLRFVPNQACPNSAEALDTVTRNLLKVLKSSVPVSACPVAATESDRGKLRCVKSEAHRSVRAS